MGRLTFVTGDSRTLQCEASALGLCQMLGQAVEGARPAALMAVASLGGLEDGLAEGHPRLALMLGEGDRHQRLVAAAAALVVPGEGEDQALGRYHLAIDAA